MNFQTKLLIISFLISTILSILIIPILKKIKIGQIEREDGPKTHLLKQGTPTMGGIIIIFAIIICMMGVLLYTKYNNIIFSNNSILLLLITVGFGVVGFIDDFKKIVLHNTEGLKPKEKMLGLFIIALLFIVFIIKYTNFGTQIYIPILKISYSLPVYIYIPFALLVILGTTNAVNLTDGVDGLSASVCSIILTTLTIIGIFSSVYEVSLLGAISVRKYFRLFNV